MKPWEMDWKEPDLKPWEMSHNESIPMTPQRESSKLSDIPAGFKEGLQTRALGILQRYFDVTNDPRAGMIRRAVESERAKEEQATTKPSLLKSLSNVGGEVAPEIALGLTSLGSSIPGSLAIGAMGGLARPSASHTETLTNAAIEGGSAAAGTMIARGFAPRPKIEPEHLASIKAGQSKGLTYTGGQIADNPIVQRAEAHAKWNPLLWTKWHAIGVSRQQDDQFIKGLLKETGIDEKLIPKNPSLSPEMLQKAHDALSVRYNTIFPQNGKFDVSPSAQPGLWKKLRDLRPNNLNLIEDDRRIVADAARQIRQLIYQNDGSIPAPLYQDAIGIVDEAYIRLTDDGAKIAGTKLKSLYEELLNVLPNKQAYLKVDADYARLMTAEDLLVHSKESGKGIPDRTKLVQVMERRMPGAVIRNRSTLADLARGGQVSVGVGALPDRSTGLPVPSDPANMLTYWRWNNPVAKYALSNQRARDITDTFLKYLPASGGFNYRDFEN